MLMKCDRLVLGLSARGERARSQKTAIVSHCAAGCIELIARFRRLRARKIGESIELGQSAVILAAIQPARAKEGHRFDNPHGLRVVAQLQIRTRSFISPQISAAETSTPMAFITHR